MRALSAGLRALILATVLLPASARAGGPVLPLEVETSSGRHFFNVEWEKTDAERERGLMDRKSMAADHGMLFDFRPHDQAVMFWMKDTLIPLDMIFIGHDGRVVSIKHDAKPMDEAIIKSGGPTTAVLEVNAGVADKMVVKVGDQVKHTMFGNLTTP